MNNIQELLRIRTKNYTLILLLLIIFTISIYSIKFIYPKKTKNKEEVSKVQKAGRFLVPFAALSTFFISSVLIAGVINNGAKFSEPKDQYSGIIFLVLVGAILTFMNFTVLKENNLKDYIKGKKFSVIGVFMALGVSAIVFGFLDNFGMKLGTEALDNSFVQIFLSPFSVDNRFMDHKKVIAKNITYINNWANGKWKSVINQVLRFRDEIKKASDKSGGSMKDLLQDIDEFIENDDARPLEIPNNLMNVKNTNKLGSNGVRDFIKNIKDKYDVIDGSKSMLGNTFSDFIGAILGAAIINLFIYMTSYDGIYSGDSDVDDSFFVKHLNKMAPFLEAFFIAIGCLIPVFIHIAMSRDNNNNNNRNSWVIVGIIACIMIIMMFLSVNGVRDMTIKDKKKSIKKTLLDLKDRLDIKNIDIEDVGNQDSLENEELNTKINNLISELNVSIESNKID